MCETCAFLATRRGWGRRGACVVSSSGIGTEIRLRGLADARVAHKGRPQLQAHIRGQVNAQQRRKEQSGNDTQRGQRKALAVRVGRELTRQWTAWSQSTARKVASSNEVNRRTICSALESDISYAEGSGLLYMWTKKMRAQQTVEEGEGEGEGEGERVGARGRTGNARSGSCAS
eukprot:1300041-Rhodomonas_salina.1